MTDRREGGWQKAVAPPAPGSRPGGLPLSPMQALIRDQLARKEAERVAAIRATVEQCDEHWREVVRWAIDEYERQLQTAKDSAPSGHSDRRTDG